MDKSQVQEKLKDAAPDDREFMFSSENLKKMVLELNDHQRKLLLDIIRFF